MRTTRLGIAVLSASTRRNRHAPHPEAGRAPGLRSLRWAASFVAVAIACLGCVDLPESESVAIEAISSGCDGGHDGGCDAGPDAGRDGGIDGGTDGGGTDAGSDGGSDVGTDGGRDGGTDAGRDGGTDAGHDAGHDAGPDTGPDAGMCTTYASRDDSQDLTFDVDWTVDASRFCRRIPGLGGGGDIGLAFSLSRSVSTTLVQCVGESTSGMAASVEATFCGRGFGIALEGEGTTTTTYCPTCNQAPQFDCDELSCVSAEGSIAGSVTRTESAGWGWGPVSFDVSLTATVTVGASLGEDAPGECNPCPSCDSSSGSVGGSISIEGSGSATIWRSWGIEVSVEGSVGVTLEASRQSGDCGTEHELTVTGEGEVCVTVQATRSGGISIGGGTEHCWSTDDDD